MLRPAGRKFNSSFWRFNMIRGLKFVSIPVRNQDASLKFFTEKLGFKVGTDQPFKDRALNPGCGNRDCPLHAGRA
jgi:catechol 2,3-dioxygenase-like lactoylglutathione lyase family enzyme